MRRAAPDGCAARELALAEQMTDPACWAAVAAVHDLRGAQAVAEEAWAEAWRLSHGALGQAPLRFWLDSSKPLAERYLALRAHESDWAPGPLLGLYRQFLLESGDREEWLSATERLRPRLRLSDGLADDLPEAARLALPRLAAKRLRADRLDDGVLAVAFGSPRHGRLLRHRQERGALLPQAPQESVVAPWHAKAEAVYAELAAPYRHGVLALCDEGAG